MANIVSGIALVGICAAGYIFSFYKAKKEQYHISLLLLVLCGFALRVFASLDNYLHTWDERYHALVAKHLMTNFFKPVLYVSPILPFDHRQWTANHIWLHKQPLALWLMALSFKTFGIHEWAARVPSILTSSLCIVLVYDITRVLYDNRTAIIAAFLCSIHGLTIELASGRTGTDHIDAIFLFFILVGVWASVKHGAGRAKGYIWLCGLSMGLAILTKWLPALILLPIWFIVEYKISGGSFKQTLFHLVLLSLIAAIIAIPWQLYIFHVYPTEARWENIYNSKHFFEAVEGQAGYAFYYFDHLRMEYGELVYLPVIWFSYTAMKFKRGCDILIFTWFWAIYLFFSVAATKMPAYTIIAAPAVFIMTARGFIKFREIAIENRRWSVLFTVAAYCFLLLPVRYSIERLKPFGSNDIPQWMTEINDRRKLAGTDNKIVYFNVGHPIEMMFYTDCIAYDFVPDSNQIRIVERYGYKAYVNK